MHLNFDPQELARIDSGAIVVWFGSNTRKVKDSVVDHGVDDDYNGLPQRTGLGCIDRRCQGPGLPQWH